MKSWRWPDSHDTLVFVDPNGRQARSGLKSRLRERRIPNTIGLLQSLCMLEKMNAGSPGAPLRYPRHGRVSITGKKWNFVPSEYSVSPSMIDQFFRWGKGMAMLRSFGSCFAGFLRCRAALCRSTRSLAVQWLARRCPARVSITDLRSLRPLMRCEVSSESSRCACAHQHSVRLGTHTRALLYGARIPPPPECRSNMQPVETWPGTLNQAWCIMHPKHLYVRRLQMLLEYLWLCAAWIYIQSSRESFRNWDSYSLFTHTSFYVNKSWFSHGDQWRIV